MDFNSKTDELEHRMEIEDTRLEVVEELGFQVAFLGCGWIGCALGGSYWWLLAGLPLYFVIRRPYLKQQEAAENAWSDRINAVD